jgi:uncharacterized protein (TIGR02145 family)
LTKNVNRPVANKHSTATKPTMKVFFEGWSFAAVACQALVFIGMIIRTTKSYKYNFNIKKMKKKAKTLFFSIAAAGILLFLASSCKKGNEENNGIPPVIGTVTDIDGNVYRTVIIGTQIWMAENLKTTRYKDGTSIPLLTNDTTVIVNTPAYCYYNGDASNKDSYGVLYNWYAVNTGNLAPTGWRVPTDEDWTILSAYLGGQDVAGGKLKETTTTHWLSPNTQATNEIGFTAVPGGSLVYPPISYRYIGDSGYWWTSSNDAEYASCAWIRSINYLYGSIQRASYGKQYGFSVRCVIN